MGKILGIDVSEYQGNIDWKKVKSSGINFAIVRAGYGRDTIDKKFKQNVEGIIANGIGLGFYWFIYGHTEERVLKNAECFEKAIRPYKDKITHKVWCDFEYDTDRYANDLGHIFTKEERTHLCKVFCEYLRKKGYDVGIYSNKDYLETKFNDLSEYPLWYAQYSTSRSYDCFMWQYTSKGSVQGINGGVDMNEYYGTEPVTEDKPSYELSITLPLLSQGSKGNTVKALQGILIANGCSVGWYGADGDFGKKTKEAVIKFQKKNGLTADGIVGPATWTELLT